MQKSYKILTSLAILPNFLFPHYAAIFDLPGNKVSKAPVCEIEKCLPAIQNNTLNPIISHKNPYKVLSTRYVVATAYSSTPDQTDSTPFIAASGKPVYDGMIAANFLRFGTKVRIPKEFGEKIFTVDDRMHFRFSDRVDLWYQNRDDALQFGAKRVKIEIVK